MRLTDTVGAIPPATVRLTLWIFRGVLHLIGHCSFVHATQCVGMYCSTINLNASMAFSAGKSPSLRNWICSEGAPRTCRERRQTATSFVKRITSSRFDRMDIAGSHLLGGD